MDVVINYLDTDGQPSLAQHTSALRQQLTSSIKVTSSGYHHRPQPLSAPLTASTSAATSQAITPSRHRRRRRRSVTRGSRGQLASSQPLIGRPVDNAPEHTYAGVRPPCRRRGGQCERGREGNLHGRVYACLPPAARCTLPSSLLPPLLGLWRLVDDCG